MESETVLGLVALIWLVSSFLLMARFIRVGRSLTDALAARHPATYEELGRPRPSYFDSVRRTRFSQFVGRREFENLSDGSLVAEFESYRKSEARVIVFVLASGTFIVLVALVRRQVG